MILSEHVMSLWYFSRFTNAKKNHGTMHYVRQTAEAILTQRVPFLLVNVDIAIVPHRAVWIEN